MVRVLVCVCEVGQLTFVLVFLLDSRLEVNLNLVKGNYVVVKTCVGILYFLRVCGSAVYSIVDAGGA